MISTGHGAFDLIFIIILIYSMTGSIPCGLFTLIQRNYLNSIVQGTLVS